MKGDYGKGFHEQWNVCINGCQRILLLAFLEIKKTTVWKHLFEDFSVSKSLFLFSWVRYSGSVFLNASFGINVVLRAFNYEKVLNSKEVTHCVAVKKDSSNPSMVVFSRKFVYYILFSISFSFRQIFSFSFGLSFFLLFFDPRCFFMDDFGSVDELSLIISHLASLFSFCLYWSLAFFDHFLFAVM